MKSSFRVFTSIFSSISLAVIAFSLVNLSWSGHSKTRMPTLSESLQNVVFPEALAGIGTDSINIFDEYESWTYSESLHSDDRIFQVLRFQISNLPSNKRSSFNLMDMNGDGLLDGVYYSYATFANGGMMDRIGVFLNNGDIGFDIGYKCVYETASGGNNFYGDCASG